MNKKCDIPIKSWCAKKVNRCRAGGLISKNFHHSLEIVQILISMAIMLFLAMARDKVKHLNTFELDKNQKGYWEKRRNIRVFPKHSNNSTIQAFWKFNWSIQNLTSNPRLYNGMHLNTKRCDFFHWQKFAKSDSLLVHAQLPRFRI